MPSPSPLCCLTCWLLMGSSVFIFSLFLLALSLSRPRVYVQNVSVFTGTTRTCVATFGRGAGTHGEVSNGDVVNLHTGFFQRATPHTPTHHTTPHHTPHTTHHTPHTTHHTPHTTHHTTPHHTPTHQHTHQHTIHHTHTTHTTHHTTPHHTLHTHRTPSKSICVRTVKMVNCAGTFSWRPVAIFVCKSFVKLGYGAVACFFRDS